MDHRGAKIRQYHGNRRSRYLLTEIDHANADEREMRVFAHNKCDPVDTVRALWLPFSIYFKKEFLFTP
jgi:hypothetical protein